MFVHLADDDAAGSSARLEALRVRAGSPVISAIRDPRVPFHSGPGNPTPGYHAPAVLLSATRRRRSLRRVARKGRIRSPTPRRRQRGFAASSRRHRIGRSLAAVAQTRRGGPNSATTSCPSSGCCRTKTRRRGTEPGRGGRHRPRRPLNRSRRARSPRRASAESRSRSECPLWANNSPAPRLRCEVAAARRLHLALQRRPSTGGGRFHVCHRTRMHRRLPRGLLLDADRVLFSSAIMIGPAPRLPSWRRSSRIRDAQATSVPGASSRAPIANCSARAGTRSSMCVVSTPTRERTRRARGLPRSLSAQTRRSPGRPSRSWAPRRRLPHTFHPPETGRPARARHRRHATARRPRTGRRLATRGSRVSTSRAHRSSVRGRARGGVARASATRGGFYSAKRRASHRLTAAFGSL